jgi:hypothetical protein
MLLGEGLVDDDDEDEKAVEETPQPPLDLLSLRHELLLSSLTNDTESDRDCPNQSTIMQSLEAATGRLYASVVKECLLAGDVTKGGNLNEHEYALHLEIRARDTVQTMVDAI